MLSSPTREKDSWIDTTPLAKQTRVGSVRSGRSRTELKEECMAIVKVKFVCGCGFQTTELVAAVVHSDERGHSLEATGTVVKDSKKEISNG